MSQTMLPDPERGDRQGGPGDDRHGDNSTTPNPPEQGESNLGDSSGLIFDIYSKAAEDEDNKRAEHWQKDAEGIIIFTGLFSAAVAALLAVSVLDLRPNSQDISAFYLGNIYQVLADPNATLSSIPSPVTKPPPFSPPRYAIWVNTLWFLSLVMSLSCALWATSLQQWARRYLRRVQPPRCSPEKRARMRAFFAEGVDKMHIPWAVEGLPMLLHLSLFLFFGGLAIFLFNVDREVSMYVIGWMGLFSLVYGFITLLPMIRQDSPYHSPLSTPAWFVHAAMTYVTAKILFFIFYFCFCLCRLFCCFDCFRIEPILEWVVGRILDLGEYSRRRSFLGMEKIAEEKVLERSSEIDVQILEWTIGALGDDDSLKTLFETIPRSFNSKMLEHLKTGIPETLRRKIMLISEAFCGRTLSSNSISDSEKLRRLDTANNAMNQIGKSHDWLPHFLFGRPDVPQTVEMGHALAGWGTNDGQGIDDDAQGIIAGILVNVRERNDSWVTLAARGFGLPEQDLRDKIALGGDSVLLAILIHYTRQSRRSRGFFSMVFEALSKLDIRNTVPRLQHDFCTLWNELVQEARKQGAFSPPTDILRWIRHPYIALHEGTDAAPTAFSASTPNNDRIMCDPSSYPFCDLASHRPDSTPLLPVPLLPPHSPEASSYPLTDGGNTASRQPEQVNKAVEPPSSSNPTTTGEIGATSHGPDITPSTNPVRSTSRPTSASPTVVAATATQDIARTATLSHPLEAGEQQDPDIVAPSAKPGTSQILSTSFTHAPIHSLATIPTSLPNTPSESYDAGDTSVSNPSPPSIGPSIPAPHPTGSATLPRPRTRGLVNTRNTCFANTVFQLLVNSPPFWNLFKDLDNLKGQRGAGVPQTGGGVTPLVDATVRFFKEFIVEEESPSTQQQSQPAAARTSRADEEKDDHVVDSLEPTYLYDAMREKRQLIPLLDGEQQDAEEFLSLYLDALDEELPTLLPPISGRQSASDALEVEGREVSQSGQTEVGSQDFMANFVESPITRIFGGKFRSPVRAPNQPDLVPTEDWRSLHLDIQHDSIRSIQDALAHISQPQSVQVGASGLGNASQQVLIESLPPVLVLHLNRVRYDAAAGGLTKIGKSIQFGPDLEIPLDIMAPNAQPPSEPPEYKLYGVLYHHGESAGNGHYTVDVIRPNGDGDTGEDWLHIDDEVVTRMRHDDVFGEYGTERAAEERCAYLLFYCRTSPIDTS